MLSVTELIFLFYFFGLGVVIGSFLNVVIYRLHTKKSLNNRSHCLSCGTQLVWYELFPMVSYVLLRGRCRTCQSKIPSRYFLVELGTGLLFALVYSAALNFWLLLLLLLFVSALMVILVYDLYHMIVPDEYVWGSVVLAIAYAVSTSASLEEFSIAVLGGVLASSFYGALWLLSAGRWIGFGDVKLAFPLAVVVGLSGVFSLVVLSFWFGALVSLLLIGIKWLIGRGQVYLRFRAQRITMKSEIPFAPFMIAAFLIVYFLGIDVLDLTAHVINYLY